MLTKFFPYGLKSRLLLRLFVYVIISSLFCSMLASAVQLSISYRRGVQSIHQNIQFIRNSHLSPLANSVFNLNEEQIRLQLKSLARFSDIVYLQVSDTTTANTPEIHEGNRDNSNDVVHRFPLEYRSPTGSKTIVGVLTVVASYADLYDRLQKNAIVIILTTSIQVFLATFFILLIIQWVITRHLATMAGYLESQDTNLESRPLELNRQSFLFAKSDELDFMVTAFNNLRIRVTKELEERRQAEMALRENENKLKEAQKIAHIGHWELNLATNHLTWSDEIFRIFEINRDEFGTSYDAFLDRIHQEDKQLVDQAYKDSANSGAPFNIVHRLQFEDGSIKVVREQCRTDYDQDGNPLRSLGTIQDITPQKEAEKELLLIKYSIDNSPSGAYRINQQGCFIYVNQTACTMTGYSEIELYQMHVWEIDPGFSREAYLELWDELHLKETITFTGTVQTKENRIVPLELHANLQEFEGVKYIFISATDITEREKAELELQEKELAKEKAEDANRELTFTKFASDNAPEAIEWIRSDDATLVYGNDYVTKMLGYNKEELYKLTVFDFDPIFNKDRWPEFRKELREKGRMNFESIWVAKDKSEFPVEISAASLDFEGEEFFIAFVRDISEKKRVQNELQRAKEAAESANQAKSEFLSNMSHELRTPLNSILGYSQILQRDADLTASQKDRLNSIKQSGDHLLTLINDVLEMAKIESGIIQYHEETINLFELLNALKNSFNYRAQQKNLKLRFIQHPDLPQYIVTDPGKLRQVLFNLIANAIKFTSQGEVSVNVQHELADSKATLQFAVKGTGPGIAKDELDKLFSAFEQTRSGRERAEGTGLGLAISQKFAQILDGKIIVESEEGTGSVFTLQISTAIAKNGPQANESLKPKVLKIKPGQKTFRILVVDDKYDNRKVLFELLESVGFSVKEAENGRECVDIFKVWHPDLIFMDIRMPVMDGFEATRIIKSESTTKSKLVIAVTASVFEEDKTMALAAGFDDYIRKPIQEDVIFSTLEKHLKVKYVFQESSQLIQPADVSTESNPLTPSLMSILPEELKSKLKQNAQELNQLAMKQLVQQIHEKGYTEIAAGLKELVSHFKFEDILQLLEPEEHN